jgi:hypothetical protein
MVEKRSPQPNRSERGIGLFFALMVLLLIAAIGAAIMLLASGESFMVGKQRFSMRVFYAAFAGLEEARARMVDYHPNAFSKLSPPVSLPSAVGQVVYITNPAAGEVVNPTDLSPANQYADTEYQQEFGTPVTPAMITATVPSAQPVLAGAPAIPYKWVRITVKTEQAARADINTDGVFDGATPVYYDGKRQNLTSTGYPVYRLTALAVLPGGARRMAQEDVTPVPSGFHYALAAGNACQFLQSVAFTMSGDVRCNSEVIVNTPLTVINGDVWSYTVVDGSGSITLNGSHQVKANNAINPTVLGGGSPNEVLGPGTVPQLITPATPTPAPLAPDTIPNPDANNIIPAVTQTNPPGQCIGGNVVFDLGNSNPPTTFEFNGATYPSACTGVNINPQNFGTNIIFQGRGTIWFSSNQSIDFFNNFGTATQAAQINIIARPRDNSVGQDTISFLGSVINILGLVYSHGEIYTKCGSPGQTFHVSGSLIAYKDPNQLGPTNNGDFGVDSCTTDMNLTYNPGQFLLNPPPGFNGLLLSGGNTSVKILNWHDMF